MADYAFLLLCGVAAVVISLNAGAAEGDDGFIWIDANTRIKVVKPVSAAAGETKAAPQPKKDKKETPRK